MWRMTGLSHSYSRWFIQFAAVAVNVVALDDHITKMHADAEQHLALIGHSKIARDHALLDCGGTFDRLHDAAKLNEGAVAHELHGPPAMFGDGRRDQLGTMRL